MTDRCDPDDDAVESPCRKVCHLDETRSFCLTCRRALPEIAGWRQLEIPQRDAIMRRIGSRSDAELRDIATRTHRGRVSARRRRNG